MGHCLTAALCGNSVVQPIESCICFVGALSEVQVIESCLYVDYGTCRYFDMSRKGG